MQNQQNPSIGKELVRLQGTQNQQVFQAKNCFASVIDQLTQLEISTPSMKAASLSSRVIGNLKQQCRRIEKIYAWHERKLTVQQKLKLQQPQQGQQGFQPQYSGQEGQVAFNTQS